MLVLCKYLYDYNNFYFDNFVCLVVFFWIVEYSSIIYYNENKKVSIFFINIIYWYILIFYLIDLCINIYFSLLSYLLKFYNIFVV